MGAKKGHTMTTKDEDQLIAIIMSALKYITILEDCLRSRGMEVPNSTSEIAAMLEATRPTVECEGCGEKVTDLNDNNLCEECQSSCEGCGSPLDHDYDAGRSFCGGCR